LITQLDAQIVQQIVSSKVEMTIHGPEGMALPKIEENAKAAKTGSIKTRVAYEPNLKYLMLQ